MVDEVLMNAEDHMQKTLHSLADNFSAVRTGRANAMVLDRIRVDYYGVPTPVNQTLVAVVHGIERRIEAR